MLSLHGQKNIIIFYNRTLTHISVFDPWKPTEKKKSGKHIHPDKKNPNKVEHPINHLSCSVYIIAFDMLTIESIFFLSVSRKTSYIQFLEPFVVYPPRSRIISSQHFSTLCLTSKTEIILNEKKNV